MTPELYDLIVRIVEEKVRDIRVTREEFDRLISAVRDLAEAQRRTEERLERLAQAQARTEERLNRLAERVDQLAHRVDQLAEAQRRTEEVVARLAESVQALRMEVGRLSETVGFGLEDIAKVVLPGWLQRHLGVEVEELERKFFSIDSREVEVNLYGEGTRAGRRVIVLGECKSRIYGGDVETFYREVFRPVSEYLGVEAVGVLFGYLIHPSAQKRAEELGIYVVASYMR